MRQLWAQQLALVLGRGGSSSGSASDYGSKGRKFDSRCRWGPGFFLSSISLLYSVDAAVVADGAIGIRAATASVVAASQGSVASCWY